MAASPIGETPRHPDGTLTQPAEAIEPDTELTQALQNVQALGERPLRDHAEAFEDLHRLLHQKLGEVER